MDVSSKPKTRIDTLSTKQEINNFIDSFPGAMALQGKIFAIGGDRSVTEDHNQVLSSVEVYDPKSGKWDLFMDALDDEGTLTSFVVMGDSNEG